MNLKQKDPEPHSEAQHVFSPRALLSGFENPKVPAWHMVRDCNMAQPLRQEPWVWEVILGWGRRGSSEVLEASFPMTGREAGAEVEQTKQLKVISPCACTSQLPLAKVLFLQTWLAAGQVSACR